MYEYKFPNSPRVIAAFNELGPSGLFDFFLPHLKEFVAQFTDPEMAALRKHFVESTARHFCPEMRIDEFYRSVLGCLDGDMVAVGLGHLHDLDNRRLRRFFNYMATHIWMVDNQPDEAIRQIEAGEFDVEVLRRKHIDVLSRDPLFVADQLVKRVVAAQGFTGRLESLVEISIGRVALKESRRDIDWVKRQDFSHINHIADWLAGAVATGAAWLSNVDDLGRPKKLMKFGTMEAMYAEADKHMRRQLTGEQEQLSAEDEELFAGDEGDFRIVRLKTPRALDCESMAMRHCVGHGAYDKFLNREDHLLLSLRDALGRRHATIEVYKSNVVQFYGKANSLPKDEYREATEKLLARREIEFRPKGPLPAFEAPAYLAAFRGLEGFLERFPDFARFRLAVGGHAE